MPRRPRHRPGTEQLTRPPAAPTTPELLETLAELLLAAASTMQGRTRDDACEDHG